MLSSDQSSVYLLLLLFSLLFTQEGASIMTGLTYNGKDKNGRPKWDGLANAWPVYLECSYRLQVC